VKALTVAEYHTIFSESVNYVNSHGGLKGCTIEPVFYDFNGNGEYEVEAQQECTTFTQSHHVLAAVLTQSEPEPALACLTGHGVPVVDAEEWLGPTDTAMFSKYPKLLYLPFLAAVDKLGVAVNAFHDAGQLTASDKVGIVAWDEGTGAAKAMIDAYTNALKTYNIPVVSTFTYNLGGTLQNQLQELSTDSKTVALKFKSAGANVLMSADAAGFMLFFPSYAASQSYFPRYLLTSYDYPNAELAYDKAAYGKGGAADFGWLPAWDLPNPAPTSEAPTNPAWTTCQSLYTGLPNAGTSFNPSQDCDPLMWLQAAFSKAPSVSVDGLATGAAALGSSYSSAATLNGSTSFGQGQYAGAAEGRVLVYNPSQGAFEYTSSTKSYNF
jgi:hypothetical protein